MRNTEVDEALLAAAVDVGAVETRLADSAVTEEDQGAAECLPARGQNGESREGVMYLNYPCS